MLFSSLGFVFRFLPIFLILYYFVQTKGRNTVLFIGSLVFYAIGEPIYVLLMMLSILVNYCCACYIEKHSQTASKKKLMLMVCVIYNIGLLLFFKYGSFIAGIIGLAAGTEVNFPQLSLPLGISFYTFQILSYVVDVYRGDVECEKNIIDLGAYLAMFPQLIAGPIVVYKDIKTALKDQAGRISLEKIEEGLITFTLGLGSKVLLANRFGQLWQTMEQMGYDSISTGAAWIGALAYTFQIYFDFNGYSLMAIGLGKMLGFEFPKNFNHPYIATSVTDFWKRWHITLTSFFRNYIYIPLGGNRKGIVRLFLNLLIVWFITGLWHGADYNFIIWGLYYFVLIILERILFGKNKGILKPVINFFEKKKDSVIVKLLGILRRIFSHTYSIFVIVIGWMIFAINDLNELWTYIGRMVPFITGDSVDGMEIISFSNVMYVWLGLGVILSTPILVKIFEKIKKTWFGALILLAIFWTSIVQLVDSSYNPFLYFRF